MKRFYWFLAGTLTVFTVGLFAAKITDPTLRLGDASAVFTQIFDIGDGATNPQISAESGKLIIGNVPLTESSITASDIDLGTASNTSRLTIGAGTDAALSALTRKAGSLMYSTDQSNVVFDDGTDLRPVGTGAGGGSGINLLDNPDAEINLNNWTASGGTFTRTVVAAEVGFGDASFKWDSNAINQTLKPDNVAVINGLEGRSCLLSAQYNAPGITAADYVVRVEDLAGNALTADVDLVPTTLWTPIQIGFICPTNDSVKLAFESKVADALPLFFDQVHLGSDNRIGGNIPVTTEWKIYSPTFPSNYGFGTVASVSLEYRRVGDAIEIRGEFTAGTTDGSIAKIPLPTGLTVGGSIATNTIIAGKLEVATNDSVSRHLLAIQGNNFLNAGIMTTVAFNGLTAATGSSVAGSSARIAFSSYSIPISEWAGTGTSENVTLETQGWYVDANIGGSNSILGTNNNASYTAPDAAALDMVVNSGSASVGIPCSGATENSVGAATCPAGNEQYGGVVNIPKAGTYKFCAEFNHYLEPNSDAVECNAVWQMVETPNNAQTISQEGGSRLQSNFRGIRYLSNPVNVCGVFKFSSAGKKTIRLMREQACAGGTAHFLLSDRSTTFGQRDFHLTGYSLTQNFPQAVALASATSTTEGFVLNPTPSAWAGDFGVVGSTAESSPDDMTPTLIDNSYLTSAVWTGGGSGITNGTFTITFSKAGVYSVSCLNFITGLSGILGNRVPYLRTIWGGTAIKLSGSSGIDILDLPDVHPYDQTSMYIQRLYSVTPGQTVTINPVSTNRNSAGHTVNAGIVVTPYL